MLEKFKEPAAIGFSNILATVISGIFWFYLASIIDKTSYGEIGYWISIAQLGMAFAAVGTTQVIIVFGAKKENVFYPSYLIGLIFSSLCAIIVFLITSHPAVGFLVMGLAIFNLMTANLNSKKQYFSYSKYQITWRLLSVSSALFLFYFLGNDGVIWGFFIGTLPGLVGVYSFLKSKKESLQILKPKISFMIYTYLTSLAIIFFHWGDKTVIGELFGFSVLGPYLLAFQFFILLKAIPTSLMVYLLPQESEGKSNKKFKIFSIILACLVVVISIPLIPIGIPEFFPEYSESILPMQILSIGVIPMTISAILESKFLGNLKSRTVLMGSLLQVGIYFSLIFTIGAQWGLEGIAISFIVSLTIKSVFNGVINKVYQQSFKNSR